MREEEVIAAQNRAEVPVGVRALAVLAGQHARDHAVLGADTGRDDAGDVIDVLGPRPTSGSVWYSSLHNCSPVVRSTRRALDETSSAVPAQSPSKLETRRRVLPQIDVDPGHTGARRAHLRIGTTPSSARPSCTGVCLVILRRGDFERMDQDGRPVRREPPRARRTSPRGPRSPSFPAVTNTGA